MKAASRAMTSPMRLRPDAHIDSYYAASANPAPVHPPLRGEVTADICIVGGNAAVKSLRQGGGRALLAGNQLAGGIYGQQVGVHGLS